MMPANDAPRAELPADELEALRQAQEAARRRHGLPAETVAPVRRPPAAPTSTTERLDAILRPHGPPPPMGDDVRIIDRVVHQKRTCACGVTWWRARTSANEACDACTAKARAAARLQLHAAAIVGMEADFREVTFAIPHLRRLVGDDVLEDARHVATFEQTPLVLILGATGAGKTTLAAAIYRHQVDRLLAPTATVTDESWVGRMVWAHAKPLSLARKESRLGAPPKLLDRAAEATVLLLDDLGQDAPEDKDDVVNLLAYREANRLPTIITCGFELESLKGRYGPHLTRRLHDRKAVIDLGGGK